MPEVTKARAPRKAPVKTVVEAAAPARKPRAKKAVAVAMAAVPAPVPKRLPFAHVANRLRIGLAAFAENVRSTGLSMAAFAALVQSMDKRNHPRGPDLSVHRRGGARAHRTWKRNRAAGRA